MNGSPVYAKMNANICGECGYTELFAEDPATLYDAYLKAKGNG
jgi:predicted nucleic-acid-binding Zn-ribbon protein